VATEHILYNRTKIGIDVNRVININRTVTLTKNRFHIYY